MKILVACEESQAVTKAFRAKGHEAYSCDILDCSGGHPEWHIKADVFSVLFDGWDLIIAFPPCDHLAVSGAAWFKEKLADGRQQGGIDFFMRFTRLTCKWAIENPIGIMSTHYRKPDQIVQPWWFGHKAFKATCFWTNGLEPLKETDKLVPPEKGTEEYKKWSFIHRMAPSKDRSKLRSKTFPGIADAMADQWG